MFLLGFEQCSDVFFILLFFVCIAQVVGLVLACMMFCKTRRFLFSFLEKVL